MIATVTLNPCLDKHIYVHGLTTGETNRWHRLRQDAGGKGIDVSRAVHEMGGETIAYGFIGGEEGETMQALLAKSGVSFSFTPVAQATRACFIVNDTLTRRQTRINAPGPRVSRSELAELLKNLWAAHPRPQLMVAGGSVPPGCPDDIYYTIISGAKKLGIMTILDSTDCWLLAGIKALPDLVKPNVAEAAELLGTHLDSEDEIIAGAEKLVAMGIGTAVISRGSDGVIAATVKEVIRAVPPKVRVRSTVGAGDSAVAGLALALSNGEKLATACRLAVAMGTAAVLTPGTELCHREDVIRLLPQVQVWQQGSAREWRPVPAGNPG